MDELCVVQHVGGQRSAHRHRDCEQHEVEQHNNSNIREGDGQCVVLHVGEQYNRYQHHEVELPDVEQRLGLNIDEVGEGLLRAARLGAARRVLASRRRAARR